MDYYNTLFVDWCAYRRIRQQVSWERRVGDVSVCLPVQKGVPSCVVGGATMCRDHIRQKDVIASFSGVAMFAARRASDMSTRTRANNC